MSQKPLFVYIGTYTTENSKGNRNAHGVGIYVYQIDRESGRWTLVQEVPTLNPAVLQYGKEQRYIYCVNSNSGGVTAYARDPERGTLTEINQAMTDGKNIMIMSVDPAGEFMVTGDHKGIVNVFRLNGDGSIGEKTDSFVLPGEKGPLNEKIQPWSRPHHLPFSPDGRFVLIADKGLDLVHSYRLDRETGKLSLVQQLKCHGASCPRHLWFHPNGKWAYINTEYTSTIIACRYDEEQGTLEPFQVVSALPDDYFDVRVGGPPRWQVSLHLQPPGQQPGGLLHRPGNRSPHPGGLGALRREEAPVLRHRAGRKLPVQRKPVQRHHHPLPNRCGDRRPGGYWEGTGHPHTRLDAVYRFCPQRGAVRLREVGAETYENDPLRPGAPR